MKRILHPLLRYCYRWSTETLESTTRPRDRISAIRWPLALTGISFISCVLAVGLWNLAHGNFDEQICAEPEVTLDYARITIGGAFSEGGEYTVDDSVSIAADGELQTSSRYEISSVKTSGNNGIATAIGCHAVYLRWVLDGGATEYIILRSESLYGVYQEIVVLAGSVTGYLDEGLFSGRVYFYQIVAVGTESNTWPVTDPMYVRTLDVPLSTGRNWRWYK